MRYLCIFLLQLIFGCISAQTTIKSFPNSANIIPAKYAKTNNLFLIAVLDLTTKGITEKIPVIYSMLTSSVDSSKFFIAGDNIACYSYAIENGDKYKPLFAVEALQVPNDDVFLNKERAK